MHVCPLVSPTCCHPNRQHIDEALRAKTLRQKLADHLGVKRLAKIEADEAQPRGGASACDGRLGAGGSGFRVSNTRSCTISPAAAKQHRRDHPGSEFRALGRASSASSARDQGRKDFRWRKPIRAVTSASMNWKSRINGRSTWRFNVKGYGARRGKNWCGGAKRACEKCARSLRICLGSKSRSGNPSIAACV